MPLFLEAYDCRVDVIREAADWPEEGGLRVMGREGERAMRDGRWFAALVGRSEGGKGAGC